MVYRALETYELREIFTNGQPLSEIATGSTLRELNEDSLEKIRQAVLTRGQETDEGKGIGFRVQGLYKIRQAVLTRGQETDEGRGFGFRVYGL